MCSACAAVQQTIEMENHFNRLKVFFGYKFLLLNEIGVIMVYKSKFFFFFFIESNLNFRNLEKLFDDQLQEVKTVFNMSLYPKKN